MPRLDGNRPRRDVLDAAAATSWTNDVLADATYGGLWEQDGEELAGPQDGDAPVTPDGQEVLISGDEIVGAPGGRASQERVIIRVAARTGNQRVRKEKGLLAKELEKGLPVGRCDRILPRNLGTAQDFAGFVDLARGQDKQESPSTPGIDELALEPVGAEEAAD